MGRYFPMRIRLPFLLLLIAVFSLLEACAEHRPDGYRPPQAQDPWAAWEANWSGFKLLSGAYRVNFRYSDGQKVSLTANMVVERGERSRIDLSSDRGAEAIVILKPEIINLVNQRDRYYLDEENTPANADRIVGLYLPPAEVTALLTGRGIEPESFDQIFKDPAEEGGLMISGYHSRANLRFNAYIDAFGRLRSIRFTDSLTDQPVVAASYLGFRLDKRTAIVWPGVIEVELLSHGEFVRFSASDVDINPEGLDLKYIYTTHAHRNRLRLEDVPPGPPLLYSSAKEYVQR
jgi:hypothetical protein